MPRSLSLSLLIFLAATAQAQAPQQRTQDQIDLLQSLTPDQKTQFANQLLQTADVKCLSVIPNLTKQELEQRDEIGALLAMAVVQKDWQGPVKEVRGHNIGGVLVDPQGHIVWWERNANAITCNGSQHGETRMMWSYLQMKRIQTLQCHTLYTSLEPCAMCSGMMTQQKIMRTVYAQTDTGFGGAIERLGRPLTPRFAKGMKRLPLSIPAPGPIRQQLDAVAFSAAQAAGGIDKFDMTGFLISNQAKAVYDAAVTRLTSMCSGVLPNNQVFCREAVDFLNNKVTNFYMPIEDHILAEMGKLVPRPTVEQQGRLLVDPKAGTVKLDGVDYAIGCKFPLPAAGK